MSYSFTVKASTKDDAKKQIVDQMAQVVTNQPDHALDQAAVVVAGGAFVDMLGDVAEGYEVHVSIHGSVGWNHPHDTPKHYISAGVGVSAAIARSKPAA